MSSNPHAGPDAVVTVKVTYRGVPFKAKLPLREMVPRVLEEHLRSFLPIPADTKIMIERYSDSAAAYVMLDASNMAVYKQLYRAAKAKSKLKLRVSLLPDNDDASPEPVAVQDAPEVVQAAASSRTDSIHSNPTSEASASSPRTTLPREYEATLLDDPDRSLQDRQTDFDSRLREVMKTNDALVSLTSKMSCCQPFVATSEQEPVPLDPLFPFYTTATRKADLDRHLKGLRKTNDKLVSITSKISSCQPSMTTSKQVPKPFDPLPPIYLSATATRQADFDGHLRELKKTNDELVSITSKISSCQPSMTTSKQVPKPLDPLPLVSGSATATKFTVCCNSCEKNIPNTHWHCSTCNDGDFDLCESCIERGISCYSPDHWLIRRSMSNGQIVNSTTETISPKPKARSEPEPKYESMTRPMTESAKPLDVLASLADDDLIPAMQDYAGIPCLDSVRTCNQCVRELPECEFIHCTNCKDYDLCQFCFTRGDHGHHPNHRFVAAVPGIQMPAHVLLKMKPGRNQIHHATCDGCDKYIVGVRHKCLDCPDWDYCGECVENAHFVHPSHRFVAIYEPLSDVRAATVAQVVHSGICCDGPLCGATSSYIRGIRYKCAVCHDIDFCANCEASPANEHNKTHPMLKFKTPVRHVTVTTSGEHEDGKRMPAMGDRLSTNSKSTETIPPFPTNAINAVQTVIDVKPVEAVVPPPPPPARVVPTIKYKPNIMAVIPSRIKSGPDGLEEGHFQLHAAFLRDSIADGTIFPPNHIFQQTWLLRNEGKCAWPAGCAVRFVGGDYMGHVDSAHPAGVSELVSASESTTVNRHLAPGQHWAFTASLRAPSRPGKFISYWRLATPDGIKFGHRLWCEINVRVAAEPEVKQSAPSADPEPTVTTVKTEEANDDNQASSMMIFPKLENESASASILEETQPETTEPVCAVSKSDCDKNEGEDEDDEWDGSDNEDLFMTDEEYDILDASDEEFLEEQQKKTSLKR